MFYHIVVIESQINYKWVKSKKRKALASFNMKKACNMLYGKGLALMQDLGYQAECYHDHCTTRLVVKSKNCLRIALKGLLVCKNLIFRMMMSYYEWFCWMPYDIVKAMSPSVGTFGLQVKKIASLSSVIYIYIYSVSHTYVRHDVRHAGGL